jgi:dsDNA-specific endonuclease/ATPase MutS2
MKIISEITGKSYLSVEECLKAEAEYEKEQKKVQVEEEKRKNEISKEKRELSKAIEKAEEKVSEANKLYEVAKTKAAEILETSNKEVENILKAAKDEVKKAEQERLDAIMAFNKKYGNYTKTITGEKAAEEFNKSVGRLNNIFADIMKSFWF